MKPNLEMTIRGWQEQWLTDAAAKGLAQGKAQAKAKNLICLLDERFGAVEPSLRERIHRAKLPTLDRWFKRAIAAPDLRSVFARQTT